MWLAYGFVEFEDRRDSEEAMHQETGRDFMDTRIVVEWSKGYKDKNGDYRNERFGYHDKDGGDQGGRPDRYRIVENFGGRKLWRIWRFATNSPKFYPPIACNI